MAEEAHGPVDFVLIELPADAALDGPAAALVDLVDAGTVRLWDVALVRKDGGTTTPAELSGALAPLAGARSGLLSADDLAEAGAALHDGTTGLLLVYENAWAAPFVAAARGAGGEMVATQRITAQQIMDALDALDAEPG